MGNYFKAALSKHHLDSAFLLEIVETTGVKGAPVSKVLATAVDASKTWMMMASDVCTSKLEPSSSEYNVLDNHAYYGIYAIAQLTQFAQAETILSHLHAFSFLFILFVTYWFMRVGGLSVLATLIFCFAVSLHPAWSFAAAGNFYMDRFYMPFALLYLMGMHWQLSRLTIVHRQWTWAGILIVGIVAALMTERGAVMMALATLAMLYIKWGAPELNWRSRMLLVILGCLFLTYVAWYIIYRFEGVSGGGDLTELPHKLLSIFARYENPTQQKLLTIYLLTNLGFLGIFGLLAGWRIGLVMLAALMPNVLVTVGGAEHNGWMTHYHSLYFPFLIYCSSIGYMKLSEHAWLAKRRFASCIIYLLPVFFGLIYNPYSGVFSLPSKANFKAGIIYAAWNYYAAPSMSPARYSATKAEEYSAAIPLGSRVTTVEGAMPTLYRNRTIYFYPIGLDVADYAVVSISGENGEKTYYAGAISYQGQAKQLDKCLNARLLKAGYDLNKPYRQFGNVVILKRE
jgi:hypothetical protein